MFLTQDIQEAWNTMKRPIIRIIEIEEGEMGEDPGQDLPWQGDNF